MSERLPPSYEPGGPPNKMKYPFFMDGKMNKEIPPWFVNCTREEAERKLSTQYPLSSAVLMRPSSTPAHFALAVQTLVDRRVSFNHYRVDRRSDGFKIDITDSHRATRTLSEIMEIFLKMAGAQKYQMFGITAKRSVPTSPVSPTAFHGTPLFSGLNQVRPPVAPRPIAATPCSGSQRRTDVQSRRAPADGNYITPISDQEFQALNRQMSSVKLPADTATRSANTSSDDYLTVSNFSDNEDDSSPNALSSKRGQCTVVDSGYLILENVEDTTTRSANASSNEYLIFSNSNDSEDSSKEKLSSKGAPSTVVDSGYLIVGNVEDTVPLPVIHSANNSSNGYLTTSYFSDDLEELSEKVSVPPETQSKSLTANGYVILIGDDDDSSPQSPSSTAGTDSAKLKTATKKKKVPTATLR